MSKGLVSESLLTDIADALRRKLGTTKTFTPAEMAAAIYQIVGGDSDLGVGIFGSNGTYQAHNDRFDGYRTVVVDVPPDIKVTLTNSTTVVCGTADANVCSDAHMLAGYGGIMVLSEEVI